MDLQPPDQKVAQLEDKVAALNAQSRLLRSFVTMARSSSQASMLMAALQKTLDLSAELTGARKGALFLLDDDGVVTDSVLTREEASPRKRSSLIGKVLEKGLAGWAYRHQKIALVMDTATDDRWLTLPDQPYTVGSALVVPILRSRTVFGLLTLLHPDPGHFNQESASLMQATAHQLALVLENVRLYAKLDESRRSIAAYSRALDKELEKGRNFQQGFLPEQLPLVAGWEVDARFSPANQMAGDFYDVFFLEDGSLGLVIADVCDKGVGSALFMGLFRSLIRIFSGQSMRAASRDKLPREGALSRHPALAAVLRTNDYIAGHHGWMGMFATLFFGRLDPNTGAMAYINGGHEPLVVTSPTGVKDRLAPTGPALGVMTGVSFAIREVSLDPGDMLVGYTDGVSEACSEENQMYGKERLFALLDQPAETAAGLLKRIEADLFSHTAGAPQSDDITLLALRRKP